MLEYALKQERYLFLSTVTVPNLLSFSASVRSRLKYHKLKFGVDLNVEGSRVEGDVGDGIESPSSADGDILLTTSTATSPPTVSWKQGRQLLRQYGPNLLQQLCS
jgi:hypothetical protein